MGEVGFLCMIYVLCGRYLVFFVLFYFILILYLGIKCKCLFFKFREKFVIIEKFLLRLVEWILIECSLLIIFSLVRIYYDKMLFID